MSASRTRFIARPPASGPSARRASETPASALRNPPPSRGCARRSRCHSPAGAPPRAGGRPLAQAAAHAVALDGVAELGADGQAEAAVTGAVAQAVDHEQTVARRGAAVIRRRKTWFSFRESSMQQVGTSRQSKRANRDCSPFTLQFKQTVRSRLLRRTGTALPFARRRARTLRPFAVAILFAETMDLCAVTLSGLIGTQHLRVHLLLDYAQQPDSGRSNRKSSCAGMDAISKHGCAIDIISQHPVESQPEVLNFVRKFRAFL